MADIGKKIKGAATKAAKDKVSGDKKDKGTRGSNSGVDKAEKALKNRLKKKRLLLGRGPLGAPAFIKPLAALSDLTGAALRSAPPDALSPLPDRPMPCDLLCTRTQESAS